MRPPARKGIEATKSPCRYFAARRAPSAGSPPTCPHPSRLSCVRCSAGRPAHAQGRRRRRRRQMSQMQGHGAGACPARVDAAGDRRLVAGEIRGAGTAHDDAAEEGAADRARRLSACTPRGRRQARSRTHSARWCGCGARVSQRAGASMLAGCGPLVGLGENLTICASDSSTCDPCECDRKTLEVLGNKRERDLATRPAARSPAPARTGTRTGTAHRPRPRLRCGHTAPRRAPRTPAGARQRRGLGEGHALHEYDTIHAVHARRRRRDAHAVKLDTVLSRAPVVHDCGTS